MSARRNCTEFGPFRLFPAERRLLKGETPVQIGSRELDILIALVERAGEVVTKRELFARVWPDVVVEESSLRVHVAGLRKVLADGQDQARYIVNVPGRGYSFVASLTGAVAPASPTWAGAPPQRSTRIIGRDNDISAIAETYRRASVRHHSRPRRRRQDDAGPGRRKCASARVCRRRLLRGP